MVVTPQRSAVVVPPLWCRVEELNLSSSWRPFTDGRASQRQTRHREDGRGDPRGPQAAIPSGAAARRAWRRVRHPNHHYRSSVVKVPRPRPPRSTADPHGVAACVQDVPQRATLLAGPEGFEPSPGGLEPRMLPLHHGPMLAASRGFEPRLPDSESGVLPLDEPAILVGVEGFEPSTPTSRT